MPLKFSASHRVKCPFSEPSPLGRVDNSVILRSELFDLLSDFRSTRHTSLLGLVPISNLNHRQTLRAQGGAGNEIARVVFTVFPLFLFTLMVWCGRVATKQLSYFDGRDPFELNMMNCKKPVSFQVLIREAHAFGQKSQHER